MKSTGGYTYYSLYNNGLIKGLPEGNRRYFASRSQDGKGDWYVCCPVVLKGSWVPHSAFMQCKPEEKDFDPVGMHNNLSSRILGRSKVLPALRTIFFSLKGAI